MTTEGTAGASSGASRYQVLMPIAAGGMATVELALQVSPGGFERLVALKRVKPHLASSEDIAAMFAEESRVAARLNHPNLIHAYEVAHDQVGSFLAMEYLSGQSYGNLIERVGLGELDLRVALEVLIGTLDGLECVHGLRDIGGKHMALVHRDISPSNLFITYGGQVKVLDFGIAKARLSTVETQVGVVKGKVKYMAPEQALGTSVDARADLYAVGVMLWEALSGERRWGDIPEAVVAAQLSSVQAPRLVPCSARQLPERGAEICVKALAFEPAERYQTAAEFRVALEGLAASLGARVSARGLADYVLDFFSTENEQTEQRVEQALAQLKSGSPANAPVALDVGERDTYSKLNTRPLAIATRNGPRAVAVSQLAAPGAVPPAAKAGQWRKPSAATWVPALVVACVFAGWLGLRPGAKAEPQAAPGRPDAAPVAARPSEAAAPPTALAVATPPPAMPVTASATAPAIASSALKSSKRSHAAVAAPRVGSARRVAPKPAGMSLDRESPW